MLTDQERVAAGAAWLDKTRPSWVDEIDLDRLDLAVACQCVLGQIVCMEAERQPFQSVVHIDEWDDEIVLDSSNLAEDGYDAVIVPGPGMTDLLALVDDLSALVMSGKQATNRGFHVGGDDDREWHEQWEGLTNEWRRVIVARRESK